MHKVKQSLVIAYLAAGLCSHAANAADGAEKNPANLEIHGKLTVHVSEKLNIPIVGPAYVAWSPDDSVLGVSSNYYMKLNTYDNSGHQLSDFHSDGHNLEEILLF